MSKLIDITGVKHGMLTPLKFEKRNGRIYWYCLCDCGNHTWAESAKIRNGHTTSCGCYKKIATRKHGLTKTRLHNIWCRMHSRCTYNGYDHFADYGGRGIRVCSEWSGEDGFLNFYEWAIGSGYEDNLSIDRIDVNKDYEPSNCRWADQKTQCNNKRNNIYLTLNGETMTQTQWSEKIGISSDLIHQRISKLGWSVEKALTTPVRGHKI